MKLKCPNCNSDLRLSKSYSGADWNCEKGEGSNYGWEVRLNCISCPRTYPLGNIKEEKDFSPAVNKAYIDEATELSHLERNSLLRQELDLLHYWKVNRVKWVYKYKNRIVQTFDNENRVNNELFCDLTCGGMFADLVDAASDKWLLPDDVKADVDSLIFNRSKQTGANTI